MGAAKAADDAEPVELTPEQIEARKQVKDAKKALKAAKHAEEEAAKQVELAKALKEEVEKDREIIASLTQRTEERLAQVEKMAAPGGPAKTRTQEQVNKAAEHDATDLELAKFEKLARDTTEPELRRGYTQAAKELRVKLAEANKS
jgi:ribosome-binding ATPase YchF (GTP1/OBG family)